jgi:hypothetical protein
MSAGWHARTVGVSGCRGKLNRHLRITQDLPDGDGERNREVGILSRRSDHVTSRHRVLPGLMSDSRARGRVAQEVPPVANVTGVTELSPLSDLAQRVVEVDSKFLD